MSWYSKIGPAPEEALIEVYIYDDVVEPRPNMLMVCGFHSRTQGAVDWRAAGGGLHIGPACDIDGCKGE